jgi:hypothetical protein
MPTATNAPSAAAAARGHVTLSGAAAPSAPTEGGCFSVGVGEAPPAGRLEGLAGIWRAGELGGIKASLSVFFFAASGGGGVAGAGGCLPEGSAPRLLGKDDEGEFGAGRGMTTVDIT